MTEQQLARYEARYRSHLRIMLAFDELQELTAEIRRSWARTGQMERDLAAVIEERDEARFTARCLAGRIREYRHLNLTDLQKELSAAEAECSWLIEESR